MNKREQEELARRSRERQRLAANAFDDAQEVVGPVQREDGEVAEPEELLGEAAKRLRRHDAQHDVPHARDLADDCEDLADPIAEDDEPPSGDQDEDAQGPR